VLGGLLLLTALVFCQAMRAGISRAGRDLAGRVQAVGASAAVNVPVSEIDAR
jgi:hypothetical protein